MSTVKLAKCKCNEPCFEATVQRAHTALCLTAMIHWCLDLSEPHNMLDKRRWSFLVMMCHCNETATRARILRVCR